MPVDDPDELQLRVLRYVRDHGIATVETIAREVLRAPVTTFGRTLKVQAAEETLSSLVATGLLEQRGTGPHAEYMPTTAGRRLLRERALQDR